MYVCLWQLQFISKYTQKPETLAIVYDMCHANIISIGLGEQGQAKRCMSDDHQGCHGY